MPRPPADPSGPAKPVTVHLSPESIRLLDHHASIRGLTRSALLARLLRAVTEPVNPPKPAPPVPRPKRSPK